MSKWEKVKLGDVCEKIGSGATPKGGKNAYKTSGISLIRSQNVLDFSFAVDGLAFIDDEQASKLDNVALKEHDVLINITGDSVARVCIVPPEFLPARVNQHVAILRCNDAKINYHYLQYLLIHQKDKLLSLACAGATRNALTKGMLENFEIPLPPLEEQKRIAAILSSLDDKIEVNNQINKNLEEQAQAIFKSWFVNFEPFGGVMPKDWREGTLGEVASITMGQSPRGSSYNEVNNGTVFYQGRGEFGWRFPTQRLFTTEPKRLAYKNDILMSVRAPVGDINVSYEDCCIGRGLSALRSPTSNQSFLLYLMQSLHSSFDVFNGDGTVFGSINKNSLHEVKVIVPNEEYITKFEKITSSYDKRIFENSTEIRTLTQIRNALLPKLMNGEIDV